MFYLLGSAHTVLAQRFIVETMYLEKTEKHTTSEFLVYQYDQEMGTLTHIYFKFMAINEINIYFYLRTVSLLKI